MGRAAREEAEAHERGRVHAAHREVSEHLGQREGINKRRRFQGDRLTIFRRDHSGISAPILYKQRD